MVCQKQKTFSLVKNKFIPFHLLASLVVSLCKRKELMRRTRYKRSIDVYILYLKQEVALELVVIGYQELREEEGEG